MARVWETTSGAMLTSLEGHASEIVSASFSPGGKRIVPASADKTANVWNTDDPSLLVSLEDPAVIS